MREQDFIQLAAFAIALIALTPLLGKAIAWILRDHPASYVPNIVERTIYRLCGVLHTQEMHWTQYLTALLTFHFAGFVLLFCLLLFQGNLPANPSNLPGLPWDLALNTTVSFLTNTNWQAYSGEATLSYLSQCAGLTVQNFLSASTGIAVMLALVRGLIRKESQSVGNFWADLTKTTLYLLLPLSALMALVLVNQGVVQTFGPSTSVTTLEGAAQVIPLGPAASQIAIKQLGSNGGGFFGVNSAHPFENPTPLTNLLEILAILLLPCAMVDAFGRLLEDRRQGTTLLLTMAGLLTIGITGALWSEFHPNPLSGLSAAMEGKEVRFGVFNSVLWNTLTSATSNGSVNAMLDSFSPLAGLVALWNMLLGEVVFGGVGAGVYGMILFVILTVFIAGLMVGRSPEYLGKKIENTEVRWAVIGVLAPCVAILSGAALACVLPEGIKGASANGPHGLTQILYACTSAAANNGSAFGGLNANTPFFNVLLSVLMLLGRFLVILPVLAIAGNLATKRQVAASSGTFPTTGPTFRLLLAGVILIVGALTFLPVLSLGPIVEHLLLQNGISF